MRITGILLLLSVVTSGAWAQHRVALAPTEEGEPANVVALYENALGALGHRSLERGIVPLSHCGFKGTLSCGSNVSGTLNCLSEGAEFYVDFYTINGTAGSPVTIRATSTVGKQILVTIQRLSDGVILAQNFGFNAATVSYVFPTTGSYAVGIAIVEKFATGSYNITVSCDANPPPTTCPILGTFACGGVFNGTLESSDTCLYGADYFADSYRFNGVEGRPVEITVSGGFPVFVEVVDRDEFTGVWVQGRTTEKLVFTPSITGEHLIRVSSQQQRVSGSYSVRLDCISQNCRTRAVRR